MKLREEPGAESHLIAYERSDLPGQKESRYRIVPVGEPAELKAALSTVLGTRVVVSKARRLFIFEGVRIHLDRVDGLGNFIEFEAVATGEADLGRCERLLSDLGEAFEIVEDDLLSVSYSDLLEAAA